MESLLVGTGQAQPNQSATLQPLRRRVAIDRDSKMIQQVAAQLAAQFAVRPAALKIESVPASVSTSSQAGQLMLNCRAPAILPPATWAEFFRPVEVLVWAQLPEAP